MKKLALAVLMLSLSACTKDVAPAAASGPVKLPVKCAECGATTGLSHTCGRSRWCDVCRRDAADGHRCGVTGFCAACRRETGEGHRCKVTRNCPAGVWRVKTSLPAASTRAGSKSFCPSFNARRVSLSRRPCDSTAAGSTGGASGACG